MRKLLPLVGALAGALLGAQPATGQQLTLTTTTPHIDIELTPGPLDIIAHTDRSCTQLEIDAYLVLYRPDRTVAAQNDDGAHNYDTDCVAARLTYQIPEPGWILRVQACCGRLYGPLRLEWVSSAPSAPSTTSSVPAATTTTETSTTTTSTTTTTTAATTTTATPDTSAPSAPPTTETTTPETTAAPTTTAAPPDTIRPTSTPTTESTVPDPPLETSTTTTTAASTTTRATAATSTTTTAEAPAQPSPQSTSTTQTPTTSSSSTTTLPEPLVTDETPIEQIAALSVDQIQQLPLEQRQRFENQIDIYSGKFENYIPTGSNIPVRERRALIAATSMIAASTTVPTRRRS